MKKYTMLDIAEMCGVSKTLVSRILNNDATLKCRPEVRQKVMDKITEVGYLPDNNARELVLRSTGKATYRVLCVRVKSNNAMGHPYYDRMCYGIKEESASRSNTEIEFTDISALYDLFRLGCMAQRYEKTNGIILLCSVKDEHFFSAIKKIFRHVLIISNTVKEGCDSIMCDTYGSLQMMLEFIKNKGKSRIGVLYGIKDDRTSFVVEEAKKIGLEVDGDFCVEGRFDSSAARQAMLAALDKGRAPEVMFCMNDEMAIGCMKALEERGYKVPEDVGVTGHDNILISKFCNVPLTTVNIAKEEIGRLALSILTEKIKNNRRLAVAVNVPFTIIERNSI